MRSLEKPRTTIWPGAIDICDFQRLPIDLPDSTTPNAAKMPSEVSDIKQFIEICRRKDAQCTSACHTHRVRDAQKRRTREVHEEALANAVVNATDGSAAPRIAWHRGNSHRNRAEPTS